jgi:hypothetical protein
MNLHSLGFLATFRITLQSIDHRLENVSNLDLFSIYYANSENSSFGQTVFLEKNQMSLKRHLAKLNAHTIANMSEIAILIRQIIGWHVHNMLIINPNTRCFNLIKVGTAKGRPIEHTILHWIFLIYLHTINPCKCLARSWHAIFF